MILSGLRGRFRVWERGVKKGEKDLMKKPSIRLSIRLNKSLIKAQ